MKKFLILFLMNFMGFNFAFAQENDSIDLSFLTSNQENISFENNLTKKGRIFAFWGWNLAKFSNSNIHFKGNGNDFTLKNVKAHDRQSKFEFDTYFNPGNITLPQTNYKIGYFVKDNIALVIGLDHMKYVMDQDQIAEYSGTISDPKYAAMVQNGNINLADAEFLTYEHTDGLNYINAGLEKYKHIFNKKNFDVLWAYGGGLGAILPKTNAKLFGNERSDRFHLAGFGVDGRTSLNTIFWDHLMVRVEGKAGYINLPDVKTTLNKSDKASQSFLFAQINFGLGYTFNTKNYN